MILADKIITLRKKNGWSQEELAELLGVSRQSISKWEGAQAVPDLKRIIRMSEVFGVSTDFLVKDEMELETQETQAALPDSNLLHVSMADAGAYLALKEESSLRISLGVLLCILSPVTLIALAALQEAGKIGLSENAAGGIGLVVLLLIIAGAVAIFVSEDMKLAPFKRLETDAIETEYGVTGMVREKREQYGSTHTLLMVAGIVLCVLAAVPLFLSMAVFDENELAMTLSLCLLLCFAGAGVYLIVRTSTVWEGYDVLLEEQEYGRERKQGKRKKDRISGIFWPAVAALYLGISFFTMRWDRTWIIWPVAAVGYGAIEAFFAPDRE